VTASPSTIGETLVAAAVVAWLLGVVCVAVMRFRAWRRIRAAVRVSIPLAPPHVHVPRDVDVRLAPGLLEPGVVGWRHPILLLPADLGAHLTSSELDAVIAHEMCHVRRWDNHTAMLHMLTEALCWFHPLVWWIGARLVSERERACDEAVLRQGSEPTVYAQAIVKTCARYVASPLACVAGVTGSDLQQRIEMIMTNQLPMPINLWRRVAMGSACFLAIGLPVAGGMRNGAIVVAAQVPANVPDDVRFEVVSIRPNPAGRGEPTSRQVQPGGRFVATNMPIKLLIGEVYRVPELRMVGGPDWLETEHFDIDARANRELTPGPGGALDTALRALLADRFKLVVRTEMREMPIFAPVTARPDRRLGPNLQSATRTDCDQLLAARNAGRGAGGPPGLPPPPPPGSGLNAPPCGARTYPGRVAADSMPLSYLAGWVGGELRRTTIDRTGLTGRYNYVLTWTPDQLPPAGADVPPIDVNGPPLPTALEEQLGLKIEPPEGRSKCSSSRGSSARCQTDRWRSPSFHPRRVGTMHAKKAGAEYKIGGTQRPSRHA